jgi:hypothetical protein
MDQNSLPLPVHLEVFPPLVRKLFLWAVALFVGFCTLLVVIGLLGAWT